VAHDFNNLLTVIIGFSDLVLGGGSDPAADRQALEQIRAAGERAATLTRQLLAFGRKQVLRPRVLDLSSVVEGSSQMLRRLIGEDVSLVTSAAADLWPVRADPGQLEQVIVNLAVNARDAMPAGGTLRMTVANVHLDAAFALAHMGAQEGPHVLLSVED